MNEHTARLIPYISFKQINYFIKINFRVSFLRFFISFVYFIIFFSSLLSLCYMTRYYAVQLAFKFDWFD